MSKIRYYEKTDDFDKVREQFDPSVVEKMVGEFDADQDFFNAYLVRRHETFGERFVVH